MSGFTWPWFLTVTNNHLPLVCVCLLFSWVEREILMRMLKGTQEYLWVERGSFIRLQKGTQEYFWEERESFIRMQKGTQERAATKQDQLIKPIRERGKLQNILNILDLSVE